MGRRASGAVGMKTTFSARAAISVSPSEAMTSGLTCCRRMSSRSWMDLR